jgi:hypothetical protein
MLKRIVVEYDLSVNKESSNYIIPNYYCDFVITTIYITCWLYARLFMIV